MKKLVLLALEILVLVIEKPLLVEILEQENQYKFLLQRDQNLL